MVVQREPVAGRREPWEAYLVVIMQFRSFHRKLHLVLLVYGIGGMLLCHPSVLP